jgi:hypothetical protein
MFDWYDAMIASVFRRLRNRSAPDELFQCASRVCCRETEALIPDVLFTGALADVETSE